MLNNITIMGRFVRDPELKQSKTGGSLANFTLAVDRDFKDKTTGERGVDFIDCTAFNSTAEFVCKYFEKGQMACANGRLQIDDWTDRDGNKRRSAKIIANSVYFGGGQSQSGTVTQQNTTPPTTNFTPPSVNATVEEARQFQQSLQTHEQIKLTLEEAQTPDDDLPF